MHMVRIRTLLAFALVLVGAVVSVGCTSFDYAADIVTDDEWIAREGDTYSFFRRAVRHEPDYLELEYSRFYGKKTV
jgi:hypothetical protein